MSNPQNEVEHGSISEQRLPWARMGWFAEATGWIREQLTSQNYAPIEHIEQVGVSIWSCVLRINTATENLYFKASAPVFSYEPALTQTLAQLFPEHLPSLLVVDEERHWMLMKDAGVTLRKINKSEHNPIYWEDALRHYACMQIALIPHLDVLRSAGCPDMRLDNLPKLLDEVLNATPLLLLDQENGLPHSEYEQLWAMLPTLQIMCTELKSYGIPKSLHHDDFHDGNILIHGRSVIFFDWAECALAHPFCSLMIAQRAAKYLHEYDDEMLNGLRDAYLMEWTRYEPIERLQAAYMLAQRIGKLCRALTWYRLVSQLEPSTRREHETSFPYWLRVFLGTEE